MIHIIGTGLTLDSYDWNNTAYKWGLSQYRGCYNGDISLYFAMHKGQESGFDNEIGLSDYPLKEIQEWSGSNYFTSTTAYMIAYALYTGNKEIKLYGVDMESKDEYRNQRPCIAYWIGYGRAIGASITTATGLTQPPFKYGYDQELLTPLIKSLDERQKACEAKAKQSDGKEKEQWIGAMYAYSKIIEQVRS